MDTLSGKLHEAEILHLAAQVSWTRPLAPYPGWRYDVEWDNPNLAFQLRRQIWSHFLDQKAQVPLLLNWHHGLRMNVYLSNDLSRQNFVAGCYEPNELFFLDQFLSAGMTFIDAGANEGMYTLLASHRVGDSGRVWAFEPSDREFVRLQRNVQGNRLRNVRLFPVALADFAGESELRIAEDEHAGQNTLGCFMYDVIREARKERVSVRRLDDLVEAERLSRVDVIKMDVEGAEMRLLEGARRTLQEKRPVLLFEMGEKGLVNQGASREGLCRALRQLGYTIYSFEHNRGTLIAAAGADLGDNVVAAPAERRLAA